MQATKTLHHELYPAVDPAGALKGTVTGLNVVITGASRGVGRSMAVSYAKAGAAKLMLIGRSQAALSETASLIKDASPDCQTFIHIIDIGAEDFDDKVAALVKDADGKVDVLINNAGMLEDWKPLSKTDAHQWWHTFDINVRGVFLMTHAILPTMIKSNGGTIINVSSIGGLRTLPGASAYMITKTAVIRFADFVDADHSKDGIRCFAIHPGDVQTDLAHNMPKEQHQVLMDTAEISGGLAVYLASSRADFLKGRYVSSNWDMPELEQRKDEIVENNLLKLQLHL